MNQIAVLAMALAAGLLLGAFFFGGLWWTVTRGLASPQPAMWFFVSMILRMGVLLAGFIRVGGDDWRRWLACLLGAVLARVVVKRLTCPAIVPPGIPGARHAA